MSKDLIVCDSAALPVLRKATPGQVANVPLNFPSPFSSGRIMPTRSTRFKPERSNQEKERQEVKKG